MEPPNGYYERLAQVESSGDPNAIAYKIVDGKKVPTGTASGLYQFTEGTWKGMVDSMGLNYSLDDRFDPAKSKKVVEEFTRKNEQYLTRKLGRKPNEAELYLAHFSGMGGSNKLLSAIEENPKQTVDAVYSQKAIENNPAVFKNKDGSLKKVYEIYNWSAKKFNAPLLKLNDKVITDSKTEKRYYTTKEVAQDNTAVAQKTLPKEMYTTTKANMASYTTLDGEELNKEENSQNSLTEERLRAILEAERKQTEQLFLNALQGQNPTQEQEYQEQFQAPQSLQDLYEIVDINQFEDGGKYKVAKRNKQ